MIEIEEKYKIERKKPDLRYFRLIFFTLYTKEIKRALNKERPLKLTLLITYPHGVSFFIANTRYSRSN